MRFLVDSNVWLEALLAQEKAADARQFLARMESSQLAITEFSLYSIGIATTRLNKSDLYRDFLSDTIEESAVIRIRLDLDDLRDVLAAHQKFKLDFDDAYQYVAAAKYGLMLVSFDADFDRTERGRKTPAQALATL
jgi:hypothetical protein